MKRRSYKLICPIARALDRIGDRWTLLILRDLHAGPARFSDLQRGLTGIAANLLADRLSNLVEDGIIEKQKGLHNTALYALTNLGLETKDVIFELAKFGGNFESYEDTVDPGNLRAIAIALGTACEQVVKDDIDFVASVVVNNEEFTLTAKNGCVTMLIGAPMDPDVSLKTDFESLRSMSHGDARRAKVAMRACTTTIGSSEKVEQFVETLSEGVVYLSL